MPICEQFLSLREPNRLVFPHVETKKRKSNQLTAPLPMIASTRKSGISLVRFVAVLGMLLVGGANLTVQALAARM